mmetsp:Transcript_2970/g.4370  ORF Transcript_2970/g.4370 Transcript_2970/m.4370 type:complete len:360 (+) Transcript_2970:40-1119(+)
MSSSSNAKLPQGWTREYSKSQQRYYYVHAGKKVTQWHFPTASEVADPGKAKKRAEMNKAQEKAKRPGDTISKSQTKRPRKSDQSEDDNLLLALTDSTSVAIIVPYRDLHEKQQRAAHLKEFIPHMHQFLTKLKHKNLVSDYHIYIVEQSNDGRKFNRGKLLNIGFDYARKNSLVKPKHDVFIFHDVDLLPDDNLAEWYAQFPQVPIHVARVWDRYSNNPKYFGGVVSFSESDYKRINGYPNTFWGWGGEDDEMQKRLEKLRIKWKWPPQGSLNDLEEMTLKDKLNFLRQNKEWKCMVKWEALEEHEKNWKTNGLADLKYDLIEKTALDDTKKATKLTVDVQLNNHWADEKCSVGYLPPK